MAVHDLPSFWRKYASYCHIAGFLVMCGLTAGLWLASVEAYDGRIVTLEQAKIASAEDVRAIKEDISVIKESMRWIEKTLGRNH